MPRLWSSAEANLPTTLRGGLESVVGAGVAAAGGRAVAGCDGWRDSENRVVSAIWPVPIWLISKPATAASGSRTPEPRREAVSHSGVTSAALRKRVVGVGDGVGDDG